MKKIIREQIEIKKKQLDDGEVDIITLNNVYPSLIEDIFGDFDDAPDLNGWQCDYWATNEEYKIFGTMYYGTATIQKH